MTAMSGAMPADLAEAVRSMPCEACQAPRGGYCSCEGTHLARWELAAASALVSQQEYHAAACAARPAPPGFRRAWPWCPSCPASSARPPVTHCGGTQGLSLPRWIHLDRRDGTGCADPAVPRPAPGEPCRYHRRHWLLHVPAVGVAGQVPASRRCARKQARRERWG